MNLNSAIVPIDVNAAAAKVLAFLSGGVISQCESHGLNGFTGAPDKPCIILKAAELWVPNPRLLISLHRHPCV
jgi:hypothetical protein